MIYEEISASRFVDIVMQDCDFTTGGALALYEHLSNMYDDIELDTAWIADAFSEYKDVVEAFCDIMGYTLVTHVEDSDDDFYVVKDADGDLEYLTEEQMRDELCDDGNVIEFNGGVIVERW